MGSNSSRLSNLHVVRCINTTDHSEWRTPRPDLFSNIPILWDILGQVVQDWKREADPIQHQIDASNENEQVWRDCRIDGVNGAPTSKLVCGTLSALAG